MLLCCLNEFRVLSCEFLNKGCKVALAVTVALPNLFCSFTSSCHKIYLRFMQQHFDTIIVGGGAAGFFTAINLAEKSPSQKIAILERGKEVLSKVRISGGGRCNVTHACFDANELTGF